MCRQHKTVWPEADLDLAHCRQPCRRHTTHATHQALHKRVVQHQNGRALSERHVLVQQSVAHLRTMSAYLMSASAVRLQMIRDTKPASKQQMPVSELSAMRQKVHRHATRHYVRTSSQSAAHPGSSRGWSGRWSPQRCRQTHTTATSPVAKQTRSIRSDALCSLQSPLV